MAKFANSGTNRKDKSNKKKNRDKKIPKSLDLNTHNVAEVSKWEELSDMHVEILKDINGFKGLDLSMRDLIKETIDNGVRHAEVTTTKEAGDGTVIEFATSFKSGLVKESDALDEDDAAMDYLNIASNYISIQDKVTSLMSLGWVDLFVRLKIPTDKIEDVVNSGHADIDKAIKESQDVQ